MTRERIGVLGLGQTAVEIDERTDNIVVRVIDSDGFSKAVSLSLEDARFLADQLYRLANKIEKKEKK